MAQSHALIIEDNSKNMQVLGTLLTRQGVSHTAILDSTQVSSVLPTLDRVDVVFLDLEMPELNGYDVLKILKGSPRLANVPIVAYTVHVSEASTAFNLGFHSFLAKPVDPDQFPGQLTRILHGERVWGG